MPDIYDILDSFPELLYITDPNNYEMLYINSAGKKLFPCSDGKKCYEALHGFDHPCKPCPIECIKNDSFYTWKHTYKDKTYLFRDNLIKWNNKKAHMCIAFDITADEKTKKKLEARLKAENFIFQCIAEMHKNQPYHEMFGNLLDMIGNFLNAERVYIFDYNGATISNAYEWCGKNLTPEITSIQNMDAHIIETRISAFMQKKCVIVKDIEEIKNTSPQEYSELVRRHTHSFVTAPLFNNEELIGYIGADNPPAEKIDNIELFFTTISYFISSVIVKENTEKRLREIGYIDTLTGLYNRNKFIEDTSLLSGIPHKNFGILYADLNGLKEINDLHGHFEGDKALISIANSIIKAFGQKSSYRVGGDEFVVICLDCEENIFLEKVQKLKKYISETEYTAAIGYKYSANACDVALTVKIADKKMYQDKKLFYRHKKQSARYRHENDIFPVFSTSDALKKLIAEERFFILLQPRFNIKTGEFCASEALIRYFDDDDVIVSPTDFLPEMEKNNIIHIIDFYVFRHVCKYIADWIAAGKSPKPISINISHKTMLKPNFIENFMNIWYDYNIPKELIEIEVSEDKEKGGVNNILHILLYLKKNGFKIAVDNFGYKYADLYLFADFKFDILKLDKDIVYKIKTDEKTRKLSASLANICRSESISLVAEGIESDEELSILRDIGCDEAQGYFFDRPMSRKQLEKKYL